VAVAAGCAAHHDRRRPRSAATSARWWRASWGARSLSFAFRAP